MIANINVTIIPITKFLNKNDNKRIKLIINRLPTK